MKNIRYIYEIYIYNEKNISKICMKIYIMKKYMKIYIYNEKIYENIYIMKKYIYNEKIYENIYIYTYIFTESIVYNF